MTNDEKHLGADAAAVDGNRSAEAVPQLTHAAPTPGPWAVAYPHVRAADTASRNEGRHHSVAEVCRNRRVFVTGEARANAHLIAAAPELLKALKALVAATHTADNPRDMGVFSGDKVVADAEAAIAKAEGR